MTDNEFHRSCSLRALASAEALLRRDADAMARLHPTTADEWRAMYLGAVEVAAWSMQGLTADQIREVILNLEEKTND